MLFRFRTTPIGANKADIWSNNTTRQEPKLRIPVGLNQNIFYQNILKESVYHDFVVLNSVFHSPMIS